MKYMTLIVAALLAVSCSTDHPHTDLVVVEEPSEAPTFDYVPGIDGAEICDGLLIAPAEDVLPPELLALAPPPFQALTLTFGDGVSIFLVPLEEGEYSIVEKHEGLLGSIEFDGPGYLALVPAMFLPLGEGLLVELDGCAELKLKRPYLKIGKHVSIRFKAKKGKKK